MKKFHTIPHSNIQEDKDSYNEVFLREISEVPDRINQLVVDYQMILDSTSIMKNILKYRIFEFPI